MREGGVFAGHYSSNPAGRRHNGNDDLSVCLVLAKNWPISKHLCSKTFLEEQNARFT